MEHERIITVAELEKSAVFGDWTLEKVSAGAVGVVFSAVHKTNKGIPKKALKVVIIDSAAKQEELLAEADTLRALSTIPVPPSIQQKIHGDHICPRVDESGAQFFQIVKQGVAGSKLVTLGYFFMEFFEATLSSILRRTLSRIPQVNVPDPTAKRLIARFFNAALAATTFMEVNKYIHGDMRLNNMMGNRLNDGEVQVVVTDFGRSGKIVGEEIVRRAGSHLYTRHSQGLDMSALWFDLNTTVMRYGWPVLRMPTNATSQTLHCKNILTAVRSHISHMWAHFDTTNLKADTLSTRTELVTMALDLV